MFSQRDVETIFDRVEDGVSWEFWHDNGECNIWIGDGEWLLQVSHSDRAVVLNHNPDYNEEQVAVLARYNEPRLGVKLLTAATRNPQRLHEKLREHPTTEVTTAEISVS